MYYSFIFHKTMDDEGEQQQQPNILDLFLGAGKSKFFMKIFELAQMQ